MKDFEQMLDELLDMHPEAAEEVEALRAKVSEGMEDMGEDMMAEGEEMEMAAEGPAPFKPIPADLMDEEEEEDEEEAMY
jgi:hypothetical protein